jgi:uncharacterized protein involved in response to NO
MEAHGKPTDAYRILFPLGIVLGTAGVSIWPLYHYGVTEGYSGRAHAFVQTSGYLYAFIAGFLLTAIPRFTGTAGPSRPVQWALAAMITLSAVAAELYYFAVAESTFVVTHLLVMALVLSRFVRRQRQPPETFPLVGLGMLAGALGALLVAGVSLSVVSAVWYELGRRLLTEGMVLLLVLGVGGFLGPRLLGFAALPNVITVGATAAPAKNRALVYTVAGVTLLLSLIAEHGFAVVGMAFLRAAVASATIMTTVQPWRLPAVRTTLAWCVWTAEWLVILSLWLVAAAPGYRVDLLHVMFIGGFTLLILAVATRVTLSHGGHDLARERRSWPLRIGLATGLLALLARVGAPFSPHTYFEHLAWAALLWIAGNLFWGFFLFRLIRKGGSLPENSPRS